MQITPIFMSKKEEEFKYISEEDYKTLISIYQQKTFELFNQNIALEAKTATLNKLVEQLTDNINKITKMSEKSPRKRGKSSPIQDEILEDFSDIESEE
jgi:hypothetical protein